MADKTTNTIQNSFTGGEMSPSLFGRTDLAKWHNGASTMRNFFGNYRGGASSRAGTKYAGTSLQDGNGLPPRLITFQFNINQGYALEFGHQYMRVISAGSYVTEAKKTVVSATTANPMVVTVTGHGYQNGDWLFAAGWEGMTELNNMTWIVSNVTTDTFQLTDLFGDTVDSSAFGAYTGGGTVARIYTAVSPYAAADLTYLKFSQDKNTMSFACVNQETGTEYPPYDLERVTDTNWVFTEVVFSASIEAPIAVAAAAQSSTTPTTYYSYVVTAVSSDTDEESVASLPASTYNNDIAVNAGSNTITWAPVVGANSYNVYKATPSYSLPVGAGASYGYVGNTFGTSFVDSNIIADFTDVPPQHKNPFARSAIESVTMLARGSGYTASTTDFTITTATGTGFSGQPVIIGGGSGAGAASAPQPGTPNTGNGGGGTSNTGPGAAGGSGIVILRYQFQNGVPPYVNATGGTVTTDGDYRVHTFYGSGTLTVSVAGNVDYLVVAGGGGGGSSNGASAGGGGAGGMRTGTLAVTVQAYPVTVGQGGAGGAAGNRTGQKGGNSIFSTITSTGGGGGGGGAGGAGAAGGSGGGGGTAGGGGGAGTGGQGNSGGTADGVPNLSGGGGGAGGGGVAGTSGGAGGVGSSSSISGYATVYAAGGGGGAFTSSTGGSGGGGSISAFVITNNGENYAPSDTITFTSTGSGTGATGTLQIGAATGTYPGDVAYYQQRRVYANTINEPDTYFFSRPGSYKNFDRSVPVTDDNAIIGAPWAQQVNGIQAMQPMTNGLVMLTGSGAWLLNGGSDSVLTPSNQTATSQAYNGCNNHMPPVVVNYDILYVQSKGSIVRDLAYNFFSNVFTGTDMTILSNHLFNYHQMVQWAYCEEPYKLVWLVRDDGALLSLTYLKEQDVYTWARHDTNGFFVSVCSVTEPPVDALYVAVRRYVRGQWKYYIERMDNRNWTNSEDPFCVDSGLTYPVDYPAATLQAAAADGTSNITSATVVVGGSGYTDPTVRAVDLDGGTGFVATANLSGGAIVSLTITDPGSGYIPGQTAIEVSDPTGTGAVIHPIITNYVTFTASSGVFSAADEGKIIRIGNNEAPVNPSGLSVTGGGRAEIVEYVSATEVVANILAPITALVPNDPNFTPVPAEANQWSLSTPTITVSGLNHLEGLEVAILSDGSVEPLQTVVDGTIILPVPATAITVGLPYVCQLQTLYLDPPGENATAQGRRKNVTQVAVRINASRGIEVGTNQTDQSTEPSSANPPWVSMTPVKERSGLTPAGDPLPLYTGDYVINVNSNWSEYGQVAIQQTNPVPADILAVISTYTMGDT